MKKIVTKLTPVPEIELNRLQGTEVVAYRCPDSTSVCILTKVSRNMKSEWGFVNLNYPTAKPTFVDSDFFKCIGNIRNSRQVYVFNGQDDLVEAIYLKKF